MGAEGLSRGRSIFIFFGWFYGLLAGISDCSHGDDGEKIRKQTSRTSRPQIKLNLVLLGRIELPTSSLPMMCSTTELQQLTMAASHATGSCVSQPFVLYQGL
jgi:hypothetical protein